MNHSFESIIEFVDLIHKTSRNDSYTWNLDGVNNDFNLIII